MRKPLFGLLASAAIAFAACQGAASPSPSASAPASTAPSPSAATSPSASPSPSPVDYDQLLYAANYQPQTGKSGGSVVIGEWQAPNQLNYYFSNAFANTEVLAITTRALLNVSSDGHWYPDLAAAPITFKDAVKTDATGDGFTVHATLKPNLKWSDGQALTMNDWKFTWQWVNNKAQTGVNTLGWEQIDKIDVSTDGLSADFHFAKKFAGWLGTIGGNPPLPEHYITKFAIKDANKTFPLSSALANAPVNGPFKYSTATADTIEMVRNDQWTAARSHPAYLDKVIFKSYPDNKDGEIAAFLAGDLDLALDLQTADYTAIKGVDTSIGKAIIQPAWEYEHLDMNEAGLGQGKGAVALQDVKLRTAMAMAIDKKALYQTIFPGYPVPQDNPCLNAVPGLNYWALPNPSCPTFDLAGANKMLDDAGYTKGTDGIRIDPKSGKPLVFEHCTSTAAVRETSAQFLAKAFQAIGITLNLNFVDSTKVLFANWPDVAANTKCNLSHGNYDTSEFAYVLAFDLFGDYYYSYASEQIPTDANKGNGYNYLRLNNPDMDAAINVLKDAIDPAQQVQAAYKIQQVYETLVPEIPLYYRSAVRGVSTRLGNFFQNPGTASDMWNIEDWFVTS